MRYRMRLEGYWVHEKCVYEDGEVMEGDTSEGGGAMASLERATEKAQEMIADANEWAILGREISIVRVGSGGERLWQSEPVWAGPAR